MEKTAKDWRFRLLFALALFLIVAGIAAPISLLPEIIPSPDLIYCLAICWLIRRPRYVLSFAVISATLFCEFLILNSPGLWSAIMLLLCEYFRLNSERISRLPFWLEWGIAVFLFAIAQLSYHVILNIIFLPAAPLRTIALHSAMTALCYPMVVLVTNFVFRVTKPSLKEVILFHTKANESEI